MVLRSSLTTQKGKPMRPEYLFCYVWEGNSPPLLVVLIYKPPYLQIRSDPRLLNVIMGYLNADMLSNTNSDTKCIHELMDELSLSVVNTGPTHHSSSRDTLIDILLVDLGSDRQSSWSYLPTCS